jgi:hypothetical protein
MSLAVLRQRHTKDRPYGEVYGSGFENWPFGDGKTLDQNEALAVDDFLPDGRQEFSDFRGKRESILSVSMSDPITRIQYNQCLPC